MLPLLDLQHAMHRGLLTRDDHDIAALVVSDGIGAEVRLNIHRNGVIGGLTTALRLQFPAVHRLVGADFFESAAGIFIQASPPDRAWLDAYGAGFPDFLAAFTPAASLPYLPGVARLEWAVSQALHATDPTGMDFAALAAVDPDQQGHIAFIAHPSVALVAADQPVDAIWRAVLDGDDAALAAIDATACPVQLLVHRAADGISVIRCEPAAWRFAADLFAARPLALAFSRMDETEATILLAEHLAAGRFAGFILSNAQPAAPEAPLV